MMSRYQNADPSFQAVFDYVHFAAPSDVADCAVDDLADLGGGPIDTDAPTPDPTPAPTPAPTVSFACLQSGCPLIFAHTQIMHCAPGHSHPCTHLGADARADGKHSYFFENDLENFRAQVVPPIVCTLPERFLRPANSRADGKHTYLFNWNQNMVCASKMLTSHNLS